MTTFVEEIETKELIDKLIKNGYEHIVNAFLMNESKCLTKRSRLNKSGTCRVLDLKPKQLDDQFKLMKELLRKDLGIHEDDEEVKK